MTEQEIKDMGDQAYLDAVSAHAFKELTPHWTQEQADRYVEELREQYLDEKSMGVPPDEAFDEDRINWDPD